MKKYNLRKKQLLNRLNKRMDQYKSYSNTENFMKMMDKFAFNLGVYMFGSFMYTMGKWPHNGFYLFYSIFIIAMIFLRWVDYYPKKYHYFLIDFCYYAGMWVIAFLMIFPKNDYLYRVAFLYSNGVLGMSTAAFNNALVFHKFD